MTKRSNSFRTCGPPPDIKLLRSFMPLNSNVISQVKNFVFTKINHGEVEVSGTVVDLLSAVSCFWGCHRIPTQEVLNDLLAQGEDNAGMSGIVRWEPFQLIDSEYETRSETLSLSNHGFQIVPDT
jgi:hypothetical protein